MITIKLIKDIIKNENGFLSGIFQGLGSYLGGVEASNTSAQASRENTQKQIDWERERAQNAHQWEVEDLEKAGLNKILTVNGSGATTSGITPQMPDTSGIKSAYEGLGNILQNSIQTAQSIYLTQKQGQVADAESALKQAQAINEDYKSGLIDAEKAKNLADATYTNTKNRLLDKYGDITTISKIAGTVGLGLLSLTPVGRVAKKGTQIFKKMQKAEPNTPKEAETIKQEFTPKKTNFSYKEINRELENTKRLVKEEKQNPGDWTTKKDGKDIIHYNKKTGEYYRTRL